MKKIYIKPTITEDSLEPELFICLSKGKGSAVKDQEVLSRQNNLGWDNDDDY